jgi:hypothetical protein
VKAERRLLPLSGRNSTHRPVQICGTGSVPDPDLVGSLGGKPNAANDAPVIDHGVVVLADGTESEHLT